MTDDLHRDPTPTDEAECRRALEEFTSTVTIDTEHIHREMWDAWSTVGDLCRDTGQLLDREEFDEVTYLMLVEARDLIAKAMRREGFTE